MKALIVGRHKLSGKENLVEVGRENINFPAHSGPCQDIVMNLMAKARQSDAALIFQMMPGQVAVAIKSLIGNDDDPKIGVIINTPGERPEGIIREFLDEDTDNPEDESDLIEAVKFANPRAKISVHPRRDGRFGRIISVEVDPPLRFEFSHIEYFN